MERTAGTCNNRGKGRHARDGDRYISKTEDPNSRSAAANSSMDQHQEEDAAEDPAMTSTRRQQKAQQKLEKRLMQEFNQSLDVVQKQQEARMKLGGAAAQLAKERRKDVRALIKAVSDTSLPLEERVHVLQGRFVELLQGQEQQDKQLADLQTQLEGKNKDVEAGKAELAAALQKAASLQTLAQSVSNENKVLKEDSQRQRLQTDKCQQLLKDIQVRIEDQQQETSKVLEHNKAFVHENELLKAQLGSTQELLDELRTTQQGKIAALADKLQEQNDAMSAATKLHQGMDALLKENEALTLKAALAATYKERYKGLEKAFADAQQQSAQHREQMGEMHESFKKATKGFDKLQKTVSEQQQVTSALMQERQLLQQQVQLLQQQSQDQAEKLRRTQLQKQRLEGLCRTLQQARGRGASVAGGSLAAAGGTDDGDGAAAGSTGVPAVAGAEGDEPAATSGGADSTATADTTAAAAAEAEGAGCSRSCADDISGGEDAECGEEQGVSGICHDVVQEVLDRILQQ